MTYTCIYFANIYNYVVFVLYHCEILGDTTQELTIHKEVFSHYEDVNTFKVHLTAECYNTVTDTLTSGMVAFTLYRNTPPKDGDCTISPTNGTAATTRFQISCYGFVDDDDSIVDYSISCT